MTSPQRLHILHLTDGNRGGSQRHIVDLCVDLCSAKDGDARDFRHFILRVAPESIGLVDVSGARLLALDPGRLADGWPKLLPALVQELGIGCIHAHALAPLLEALDRNPPAVPYCVTLHDLRCIDPDFFDAPSTNPQPDAAWIARCAPILQGARAVLVPSQYMAGIVRSQYAGISPRVVENGIAAAPAVELPVTTPWPAESRQVYAVAGALGPHKGSDTLAQVANAIANPDIAGVLIGYTDKMAGPEWLAPGKLYVHGRYQQDELPALLKAYGCRLAYFPNVVPESFSYVLSEVWQAGVPALAPDTGALGERVRASGAGWLLDDPRDARAAAARIEALLGPSGHAELDAAAQRLRSTNAAVPALAVTRAQVEAIYTEVAIATAGGPGPIAADAGWIRVAHRLRDARFPGVDDSLFDAQWPALVREEQSLREWSAKLAADVGALDAQARRMQSHFEECLSRAQRLEADVRELKARNDRIEAEAAALRARSDGLDDEIAATTARNRELERDFVAIQSRNAGLEQHVVALRERNIRVESDVTALIGRNAQLEGNVVALTQRNIELDSSVAALKERNTVVEAGLAAIKQRNTRVELDAAALSAELAGTHERLKAIDADLASRRARTAELERALGLLPSSVQSWLLRHAR